MTTSTSSGQPRDHGRFAEKAKRLPASTDLNAAIVNDSCQLDEGVTPVCAGCARADLPLGGTSKCPACVAVDVHNYRALHDGRMKRREYA